jgi:DNA polymerase III subunit epsilon
MNFTAIDFETANPNPASACAVAVVEVRDGMIVAEKAWLI